MSNEQSPTVNGPEADHSLAGHVARFSSDIGARVVAFVRRTVQAVSAETPTAPPAMAQRRAVRDPWERFRFPDGSTPVPGSSAPSWGNLDASDDCDDGPPSWGPPSGTGGAPCYA